jgi:hypothetical protein
MKSKKMRKYTFSRLSPTEWIKLRLTFALGGFFHETKIRQPAGTENSKLAVISRNR